MKLGCLSRAKQTKQNRAAVQKTNINSDFDFPIFFSEADVISYQFKIIQNVFSTMKHKKVGWLSDG